MEEEEAALRRAGAAPPLASGRQWQGGRGGGTRGAGAPSALAPGGRWLAGPPHRVAQPQGLAPGRRRRRPGERRSLPLGNKAAVSLSNKSH